MVVSFCLCYGGERGNGQPDLQAVSQAARTASGQHLPLCLPRHLHLLLRRLFHHLQPLKPTVNGVSNVFCFSIFSPWCLHTVDGLWCPQSHLLLLLQTLKSTCCWRSVMSSKSSTFPSSDPEVYMLLTVCDVLGAIYFFFFRPWSLHAVDGLWCPQRHPLFPPHPLFLLQPLKPTYCWRSVMSSKSPTFPSSAPEVYMLLTVCAVPNVICLSISSPWKALYRFPLHLVKYIYIFIHRFIESSKHPVLLCFLRLIHRYLHLVKYIYIYTVL